jgi:hypothetical protein
MSASLFALLQGKTVWFRVSIGECHGAQRERRKISIPDFPQGVDFFLHGFLWTSAFLLDLQHQSGREPGQNLSIAFLTVHHIATVARALVYPSIA